MDGTAGTAAPLAEDGVRGGHRTTPEQLAWRVGHPPGDKFAKLTPAQQANILKLRQRMADSVQAKRRDRQLRRAMNQIVFYAERGDELPQHVRLEHLALGIGVLEEGDNG